MAAHDHPPPIAEATGRHALDELDMTEMEGSGIVQPSFRKSLWSNRLRRYDPTSTLDASEGSSTTITPLASPIDPCRQLVVTRKWSAGQGVARSVSHVSRQKCA
jgi:hypothetical protein